MSLFTNLSTKFAFKAQPAFCALGVCLVKFAFLKMGHKYFCVFALNTEKEWLLHGTYTDICFV
jgi:hypothetical protein